MSKFELPYVTSEIEKIKAQDIGENINMEEISNFENILAEKLRESKTSEGFLSYISPAGKRYLEKENISPEALLPQSDESDEEAVERKKIISKSINYEKTQFFSNYKEDENCSPKLIYPQIYNQKIKGDQEKLLNFKNELKQLISEETNDINKEILEKYKLKVNDELSSINFIEKDLREGNDRNVFKYFKFKYGDIFPKLTEWAEELREKRLVKNEYNPKYDRDALLEEKYTPQDIKETFEKVLEDYDMKYSKENLNGFVVELSDEVQAIVVRDQHQGKPTVLIPKDRSNCNIVTLIALAGHEIEGHCKQSYNSHSIPLQITRGDLGSDRSGLIYEAEANYIEDTTIREGVFGEKNANIPWYVLAMNKVKNDKTNFRETFIYLRDLIKQEHLAQETYPPDILEEKVDALAWKYCYRVFRGLTDLSGNNGYYMPKDKIYAEQEIMVEQLNEADLKDYIGVGKINVGYIKLLKKLGITPDQIPLKFKDSAGNLWRKNYEKEFLK